MFRGPSPLASGTSTPQLGAVPEDSIGSDVWKLPPSLRTSRSHGDRETKGKARAIPRAAHMSPPSIPVMQIGEWVVDPAAAKKGADTWRTKERVILVLGGPSADSLSPILYDETYQDTLLLIGSPSPIPSLEALLSTADSPGFIIQPTLRLFNPPNPVAEGASPLPALLEEAQSIARVYRGVGSGRRSRRMSSGGISLSGMMPDSPSMGLRRLSLFDTGSSSSLPRTPSDVSIPSTSRSRFSLSFSKSHSDDEGRRPGIAPSSGSPFDAIINFLQPSSGSQNGIREMLHQTMVLTTGAWPLVMLRSQTPDELPIPLLHVLPSKVIGPIPNIIEDYLLTFKAGVASRGGPRETRSMVVHSSVWKTPQAELANGLIRPVQSGANLLLLNGAKPVGPRALITRWKLCVDVVDNAPPPRSEATSSTPRPQERPSINVRRSSPLVPASARLPPVDPVKFSPGSPGYTNQQLEAGLTTPELAPTSMSSCSSTSGSGAEPTERHTASSAEDDTAPRIVNGDHDEGSSSEAGGTIGKKFGRAWKRVLSITGRGRT